MILGYSFFYGIGNNKIINMCGKYCDILNGLKGCALPYIEYDVGISNNHKSHLCSCCLI